MAIFQGYRGNLPGVRGAIIQRIPQRYRLTGRERGRGSKLIQAIFRVGQMKSSIRQIGRLFVKAHSQYEAETTGPRTRLDAPPPKSTAIMI